MIEIGEPFLPIRVIKTNSLIVSWHLLGSQSTETICWNLCIDSVHPSWIDEHGKCNTWGDESFHRNTDPDGDPETAMSWNVLARSSSTNTATWNSRGDDTGKISADLEISSPCKLMLITKSQMECQTMTNCWKFDLFLTWSSPALKVYINAWTCHCRWSYDSIQGPAYVVSGNTWKRNPLSKGIKVFVLSDSTNGYIYRFQIYSGKVCESADATVGLCSRSVIDLMQGLEPNHHR